MGDFDLHKVDTAKDKYHPFVTMRQIKHGYIRQQAGTEINKLSTEYDANINNN